MISGCTVDICTSATKSIGSPQCLLTVDLTIQLLWSCVKGIELLCILKGIRASG